ncbi:MAG TPA: DNA-binding response regulator [Sphingobacteriaceae bacterium]|nr:DNA-binding response regulator [Sphingobacteriaceae bacterium]
MNSAEILVIDDEVQMRRLLEITLQSNDFTVKQAATAKEGLTAAVNHPPDLIILDLGLPDESGHIVLTKLREWYTKSIIILSVQSSEEDIVKALDNGANDYLVKPFRTAELLARIRSTLRHTSSEENNSLIDCDELQIDLAARIVKKNNEIIKLTSTEYSLLSLFAQHEGKVLTHQFLLKQVWGPSFVNESQYLRVYIAQLRKKIEDNPNKPFHLITESGVGYRFIAKE